MIIATAYGFFFTEGGWDSYKDTTLWPAYFVAVPPPTAITVTDSGTAIENLTTEYTGSVISVQDSGAGTDGLSIQASLPVIPDSGAGSDSVSLTGISFSLQESGSGVDKIAEITSSFRISDSGAGSSALSIDIQEVLKDTTDTGNGSEALSIIASLSLADAGHLSESVIVTRDQRFSYLTFENVPAGTLERMAEEEGIIRTRTDDFAGGSLIIESDGLYQASIIQNGERVWTLLGLSGEVIYDYYGLQGTAKGDIRKLTEDVFFFLMDEASFSLDMPSEFTIAGVISESGRISKLSGTGIEITTEGSYLKAKVIGTEETVLRVPKRRQVIRFVFSYSGGVGRLIGDSFVDEQTCSFQDADVPLILTGFAYVGIYPKKLSYAEERDIMLLENVEDFPGGYSFLVGYKGGRLWDFVSRKEILQGSWVRQTG